VRATILFVLGFLFLLLSVTTVHAQENEFFLPYNEFMLALGTGTASEKTVFNVPQDAKASPDFLVNFQYMYFLSPQVGVGIQLLGYSQTISGITITKQDLSQITPDLDLGVFNIGGRIRYSFLGGDLQPYVFGALNYVSGSVSSDATGTLNLNGFGYGGGAGLSFDIGRSFRLTAEGCLMLGTATWESKPFQNSVSDDFNPGMSGVLIGFSYLMSQ